jgi:hypothetical protein
MSLDAMVAMMSEALDASLMVPILPLYSSPARSLIDWLAMPMG